MAVIRNDITDIERLVVTLLPTATRGPDAASIATRVGAYLDRAPRAVRVLSRLGIAALQGLSRMRFGRPIDELSIEETQELLQDLERHPSTAQALQGVKALVLLAYGAERFAEEIERVARTSELSRPDPELDVVDSTELPSLLKTDVVVVGSGAGGSVAAERLTASGAQVLVLEEGMRFSVEWFRSAHPLDRFATLYRDAGTTVAIGSPPIALPVGMGVGGSTLVNSGTCYRTPRRVLEKWLLVHGLEGADPDTLEPHFRYVEEMLSVGPVPFEVMGANGKSVIDAARSLGLEAGPLLRNAPGCRGTCQCAIGCPTNSKAGVHLSVLPTACRQGARIVTRARVLRVLHERGRACGVEVIRPDGSRMAISAPHVVVAAGALHTPPLLRRSGLGHHPFLGRNLTIHPAFAVVGFVEHETLPWRGVLQSAFVESFHESLGLLMEATSAPPGMSSAMLPGWGRDLVEQFERMRSSLILGAMIADRPSGVVLGRSRPLVIYRLHRHDAARIIEGIFQVARILDAAGAKEFVLPIAGSRPVESLHDVQELLAAADPRRFHLAAFHPVGTAAAGGIPERHPVDPSGKLRGIEGVWVADASVLPSCPEVNPQVTIMALASYIAGSIP